MKLCHEKHFSIYFCEDDNCLASERFDDMPKNGRYPHARVRSPCQYGKDGKGSLSDSWSLCFFVTSNHYMSQDTQFILLMIKWYSQCNKCMTCIHFYCQKMQINISPSAWCCTSIFSSILEIASRSMIHEAMYIETWVAFPVFVKHPQKHFKSNFSMFRRRTAFLYTFLGVNWMFIMISSFLSMRNVERIDSD